MPTTNDEVVKAAISDQTKWAEDVANHVFEEIDSMVNKLNNLRERVRLDCEAINHHLNGYLNLAADAVKASMAIENAINNIERHQAQSPTNGKLVEAADLKKLESTIVSATVTSKPNIGWGSQNGLG